MANELNLQLKATLSNGGLKEIFQPGQVNVTQDAIGAHAPVVTVGYAAEEDMPSGDVGTLGWLFLKNLDATNYVTYGPKSAGSMVPIGRIEPGEWAALRLEPGITITWQADTADVKVKMLLLED